MFLPIAVAIVIGVSIGMLLGVQLIVQIIRRFSIIVCKLVFIHVVTERPVRSIIYIILTIPKNTKTQVNQVVILNAIKL